MTKDELLAILQTNSHDTEKDHVNCDKALLEYIGDDEITKAFKEVFKWYA